MLLQVGGNFTPPSSWFFGLVKLTQNRLTVGKKYLIQTYESLTEIGPKEMTKTDSFYTF